MRGRNKCHLPACPCSPLPAVPDSARARLIDIVSAQEAFADYSSNCQEVSTGWKGIERAQLVNVKLAQPRPSFGYTTSRCLMLLLACHGHSTQSGQCKCQA